MPKSFPVSFFATSGARAINVAPKIVSGLVVKTFTFSSPTANSISAPSDFPIQFLCPSFICGK